MSVFIYVGGEFENIHVFEQQYSQRQDRYWGEILWGSIYF